MTPQQHIRRLCAHLAVFGGWGEGAEHEGAAMQACSDAERWCEDQDAAEGRTVELIEALRTTLEMYGDPGPAVTWRISQASAWLASQPGPSALRHTRPSLPAPVADVETEQ